MWRIFGHVAQQLVLALEEAAVHEVVALDARERERELLVAPLVQVLLVDVQVAGRPFPDDQARAAATQRGAVVAGEAPVERVDQVAALAGGIGAR